MILDKIEQLGKDIFSIFLDMAQNCIGTFHQDQNPGSKTVASIQKIFMTWSGGNQKSCQWLEVSLKTKSKMKLRLPESFILLETIFRDVVSWMDTRPYGEVGL